MSHNNNEVDLEFQDFPTMDHEDLTTTTDQTSLMINESEKSSTTNNMNMNNDNQSSSSMHGDPNASIWSIQYYQTFFDITSSEVLNRITKAFTYPIEHFTFLKRDNGESTQLFTHYLRKSRGGADIWGPFWIVTTLVICLIMSSQIGSKVSYSNASKSAPPHSVAADFSIVSVCATVLYSYLIFVPLVLYFVMRWKDVGGVSLVEMWSLFGYSLVLVIPGAIVCVLNYAWIRWLVLLLSFVYAGGFLLMNLMPLWRSALLVGGVSASAAVGEDGTSGGSKPPVDGPLYMLMFIGYVVGVQLLMALFIGLYFFILQ